MSRTSTTELVRFVHDALAAQADPARAVEMAAYMKTSMPFFGVPRPARALIARQARDRFPPPDEATYRAHVLALWNGTHREQKYLALDLAGAWKRFVTPAMLDLYEQLAVEGAWWDLVDDISGDLVSHVIRKHPDEVYARMDAWMDSGNPWLQRMALICQLKQREKADWPRLQRYCLRLCGHPDFFIRKAMGWALRQYARTAPDAVRAFVDKHRADFSPLTVREALKHQA